MRDLNFEAAVWYHFTSEDFFKAAAAECKDTMEWFGHLATSRQVANFGRNNQIFDKFKELESDFKRGAALAALGDYSLIWSTAQCVRGDVRGMMEQALNVWMTEDEFREFERVRISRLITYAGRIESALNNAMTGADYYSRPNLEFPLRGKHDHGYPGTELAEWYFAYVDYYDRPLYWKLPDPIPEYSVDLTISCMTGDEVPSTGVWYPDTGLDDHSLTFAIKSQRMQPAYRVTKTKDELRAEGAQCPKTETIAVETLWHPLTISPLSSDAQGDRTTEPDAATRTYGAGERMMQAGTPYGIKV